MAQNYVNNNKNTNIKRAELHLHTKLSDDISVIEPKEALKYAIAHSHKAIAFTNLNNVQDFPAIASAYKKLGDTTLKVIYGTEFRYRNKDRETPFGITVLVKNQAGIKELYKIISSIENNGDYNLADLDVLKKNRKNLLLGSCGNMGALYDAVVSGKDIEKIAAFYDYFEIYPTDDKQEQAIYQNICTLGDELGVPVVASGNCHYVDKEDEICRRVIRTVNGYKDDNKKLFLHTTEEMLEEFSYLGEETAYKTVITDANLIADIIEQVYPMREGFYMPIMENAYKQIHELAYAKAKEIYGDNLPIPIAERLETELKYIKNDKFATHYLIAYRMVKHMNDLGYYVGTRGSVGSVLTAFLLGISDTNPLPAHYYCSHCHFTDFEVPEFDGFDLPSKPCPVCGNALEMDGHNIPFEFFMGYHGSKMPDIDLNFPSSKQPDAVGYLQEMFGADRVALVGTVSTLWEHFTDAYIGVYEAKTGDYFTGEQRQYISDKLCGVKRFDGRHSGAVFVLPEDMEFEDFTPFRKTVGHSSAEKVVHLDFYSLHDTILKQDILGHYVPDMFKLLEDYTGISVKNVPWNDREIYAMFTYVDTTGIPEFDTDFMKDMLLTAKPSSFADLVQLSGLSHGTGTWIDNGEELINSDYPLSELPALRDSVFLQLLQYGLDREDAFKIAEYTRKGRFYYENETTAEFIKLMENANVPEWYINSLQKIRYLFPKAHATAYVMNAVRLAWFKIHYPTEFYAAYLSCYFNNDNSITEEDELRFNEIIEECSAKSIELIEPNAEKIPFQKLFTRKRKHSQTVQ